MDSTTISFSNRNLVHRVYITLEECRQDDLQRNYFHENARTVLR
jgi:hypothetical protein